MSHWQAGSVKASTLARTYKSTDIRHGALPKKLGEGAVAEGASVRASGCYVFEA